ncbi:LysR family transcriptional regulator [Labedaea rhizosphaerae]|uniref:DNA-binding transcriptional LysR family regulator n=1 Tax=Labedaea rhizosphaerae TaxID=598644 RepID=A0A4R6S702_LABRH|nr:LysR family transcriptional regulator [Labedaea rhizosphaerae]TDP94977.1 DNA-binding transcriptional LysR family regulator [Labedaea rhizosphaerae]
MLDTMRLRVLAAVAAHGSVTKAAEALHYSQPAVSHHLARLEAETGVRLLRKVGRGIRLTEEGELLARRATEIVGRLDAAHDELSAFAGLRRGRVRVAGFQSALSELVPATATAMTAKHPNLELQLVDAHPKVALGLLRKGDVDCALIFRYDDEVPEGVRTRYLLDDPMYLLSRTPGETLTDHVDSPWIAGCENCRAEFVDACAAAGFTPRIAYTSDDVIVEQSLVAAGLGVTTIPGLSLRSHRAAGIEATEIPGFRRRILLATFGDPPDPPATAAFVAALDEVVPNVVARSSSG